MNHFIARQSAAHEAEDSKSATDCHLFDLRRVEVQKAQHQLTRVVAYGDPQLPFAAIDDIRRYDFGFHLRFVVPRSTPRSA